MNRRRFLKYAGGAAAAIGASALGLDYVLKSRSGLNVPISLTSSTHTSIIPPQISNFQWNPTKILNGKVYDGTISFLAESIDSAIADVQLDFVPVYPSEIPRDAIPEESNRSYDFKGTGKRSEFSQDIHDLKGGKEYTVRVRAKDEAANETESSLNVPYVREFENKTSESSWTIGAHYYLWYEGSGGNHWKIGHKGRPLYGEYDSSDPEVISRQIDSATGNIVNLFLVDWWGPSNEPHYEGYVDVNLKEFLSHPLSRDVHFAITYDSNRLKQQVKNGTPSIDLGDSSNIRMIGNDFDYLAENYFGLPNYFRMSGSPLVFIYLTRAFTGDVETALGLMRDKAHENGFGLYLLGDQVYWQSPFDDDEMKKIEMYDGQTSYSMMTGATELLSAFEDRVNAQFAQWSQAIRQSGRDFIPSFIPGYDDTASRPLAKNPVLSRNLDRFRKQAEIAKKYATKSMAIVTSFNEWPEYTAVEGEVDYKSAYLKVIQEVFA